MNHEGFDEEVIAETPIGPLKNGQRLFGGEIVTPYREGIDVLGESATRLAVEALADIVSNSVMERRMVEFSTILADFELAAQTNGGSVPIEYIRSTLRDVLEAKK